MVGALVVGELSGPLLRGVGITDSVGETIVGAMAIRVVLVALIVWFVLQVEAHPPSSIGLRRPQPRDLLWLVGSLAALFVVGPALVTAILVLLYVQEWRGDESSRGRDILWGMVFVAVGAAALFGYSAIPDAEQPASRAALEALPLGLGLFVVVAAGVTEEFFFRGFLLERVARISGSLALGAAVSAALFVLVHILDQGVALALRGTPGTLAFTLLYLGTRNVWVAAFAHALLDLGAVL